jgi:thiopeptide-type bacteriocin biosynthesis protein
MRQSDWIYFGLCVGDARGGMDHLLLDAVPRLLARGLHDRWFFLRYADARGPHLRLRLRARRDGAPALREELEPMCRRAVDELGGSGVFVDTYEPEHARFGGPAGTDVAEELFERSSELALDALRAERAGCFTRFELAVELMTLVLAAFPAPRSEASFWQLYTRRARAADGAAASARLPSTLRGPAWLAMQTPLARFQAALARCAARYQAVRPRPSAEELAAHFLHLTNNRLGIAPRAEAVLAERLAVRAVLAERAVPPEGRVR